MHPPGNENGERRIGQTSGLSLNLRSGSGLRNPQDPDSV
jgi:hypothetical protein